MFEMAGMQRTRSCNVVMSGMLMMLRRSVFVVLVLQLSASVGGAEEQNKKFSGETSVNVVEVPVRVYDADTGEAITGLAPEDFQILENGAPQQITNFAELGGAAFAPCSPGSHAPCSI